MNAPDTAASGPPRRRPRAGSESGTRGSGIDGDEATLRAQAVATVRRLDALGLNRGSTGNLSVRLARGARGGMLITPTGAGGDDLAEADLVWVGDDGSVEGDWAPSSEWPFHRAAYRRRPDVNAVVHTHSVHAAGFSCLGRGLPPFHYMVAVAGGDSVPCTPYHVFGSEALSAAVADALADRDACLMAHHGLVAAGSTLGRAAKIAVEVEALCEMYLKLLPLGEPPRLSPGQMAEVMERFATYGRKRRA